MTSIETLTEKVRASYETENPERADWADWMFENHVAVVAKYGEELAKRFGADVEIVAGACLVHDIADTCMKRETEGHDAKSLELGQKILEEAGFPVEKIAVIMGDIVPNHSCRDGHLPTSLEGQVMATADSLAHFNTDFYDVAIERFTARGDSWEKICEWGLKKIERDFNIKIFFDEVREETRENYEKIKAKFNGK